MLKEGLCYPVSPCSIVLETVDSQRNFLVWTKQTSTPDYLKFSRMCSMKIPYESLLSCQPKT